MVHSAAVDEVLRLLSRREGHFALESGHHGELWLDLERLFLNPERVQPLASVLAERLAASDVEVVCGPLVEGAFVGLLVAASLRVPFTYSRPTPKRGERGLFPVGYRIPETLRTELRGRRVAVVNDVINAGSAVIGTLDDLADCAAEPVAIGALAALGPRAREIAAQRDMRLETLASLPNQIWEPTDCPLCSRGVPLSSPSEPREP